MKMRSKLLLVMVPLFIVSYLAHATATYYAVRNETIRDLHKEAEDIRAVLMATRRVYHHAFLDSGIPLTDKTLPLLPAHALSRISEDFASWNHSGLSFNNVSDRPRNPANTADSFELEALKYFREHPDAKEWFVSITSPTGTPMYHYARPIWTERYCTQCHGLPEIAPRGISDRYTTAYGYAEGDLRGLMSIKLPIAEAHARMMSGLYHLLTITLAEYAIAFALVYWILIRHTAKRLKTLQAGSDALAAGRHDGLSSIDGNDEIAQIARRFQEMAGKVRQREGMLLERDERRNLVLHGAGLATWDWDIRTSEVTFNEYWAEMLGYDFGDLEPHEDTWRALVHPDDLPGVMKNLTAHLDGETSSYEVEHRLQHRSGKWVWVLARGRVTERDEQGKPLRACGTHMDITSKKLVEQVVFESEARFHAIFEHIGSGVAIYEAIDDGEDFVFKDINPAGAKIGRIPREKHLGKRVTELYPGVANLGLLDVLKEVYRTGHARHYPLSTYQDSRITLWVENYICRLNSGEVVAMYDDLTEQKQAEAALEQRLIALTLPLESTQGVTFDELFDLEDIQRLQDEFAQATGVASIITNTDGKPITNPSNFCRLCEGIIRRTEKGQINCFKSDAILGQPHTNGPTIQPCLSGGLWDAGAAIRVGGKHIANWLIGQVRDETQTEDRMRAYAQEIGANEDDFLEAFREVPSMSRERFGQVAQVLFTLAEQLSRSAYQNVQQARFITERQQAQEALTDSEELFRMLADYSADLIWKCGTQEDNFRMLYINPAIQDVLGYTVEEFLELPIERRMTQASLDVVGEKVAGILASGQPDTFEIQHIHKNSTLVDCEIWVKPIFDQDGRVTSFQGRTIDITERKIAEEKLRSSEERYRNFVAHASEGIYRIDFLPPIPANLSDEEIQKLIPERAIIAETNEALAAMYGITAADMIGKPTIEFAPEYEKRAIMAIRAPQHQVRHIETLDRTADGSPLYLSESYNAVIEDGLVVRIWGMQRDITERKKAEEAINRAQALLMEQQQTEKQRVERELAKAQRKLVTQTRLATIGQVAGSIAHELRNPLGAVRNAAFFLKRYVPQDNPTTGKHLRIIEDEVTTANQIITDLMGVIRAEKPSKQPTKLAELIQEVLTRAKLPSGIECQVDLDPPAMEVLADASQLRQALVNITMNAIQALNQSGIIRITAQQEKACDSITIEDNGPGIQAESLEEVFEPLFTTKAKGTGLGLTICREMIERHGGTLEATKTELGGAAFCIRLPR